MKQEQIQKLLEKFYNGGTTLEEEKKLRDYFLGGEVPEPLAADREYFLAMADSHNNKSSSSLSASLENLIDARASETRVHRLHIKPVLARSLSMAASLLILVGVYFTWMRQVPKDTYTDPQLAYQETQRILLYVSQQFNKGAGQLARLDEINTPAREMSRIQQAAKPVNELKYLNNLSAGLGMMAQLEPLSHSREIMNKYLKTNNNNTNK